MLNKIKNTLYYAWPSNLLDSARANLDKDTLVLYWSHRKGGTFNFGDILNPYLVERISGRRCVNFKDVFVPRGQVVYTAIGSVLNQFDSDEQIEVWGSGFIAPPSTLRLRPKKIHAVRGPLTRKAYLELGYDCPAVYGDPALLLPRFYHPEKARTTKIGIIPHYSDLGSPHLEAFLNNHREVKLINILSEVEPFIDNLLSCEFVISSSLHGIIMADAYGIPNCRINIDNRLVGGDFKFDDYYRSVGRPAVSTVQLSGSTPVDQLYGAWEDFNSRLDLEELMDACPFA